MTVTAHPVLAALLAGAVIGIGLTIIAALALHSRRQRRRGDDPADSAGA